MAQSLKRNGEDMKNKEKSPNLIEKCFSFKCDSDGSRWMTEEDHKENCQLCKNKEKSPILCPECGSNNYVISVRIRCKDCWWLIDEK